MATTTPTFVATRVGDRYLLVPKHSMAQQPVWGLVGGVLILLGLLRRGSLGFLLLLAGGAMAYRGCTGVSLWFRFLRSKAPSDEEGAPEVGPSYQRQAPGVRQSPADEIDEASMESFPASDSPAISRSTGDDDTLGDRARQ